MSELIPSVSVERCYCEWADVGAGVVLAEPHRDCPVHTFDVLTLMTLQRHESEKRMGLTPSRTHWAHEGCPCGCGVAQS